MGERMPIVAANQRFERIRCLGEGGAGVVYEALDRERGTRVALKALRKVTAESLTFFKREFRAMQDVHHPNLVNLGELVSDGDECFFTMELVEGVDWLDYVRSSRALVAELSPTGSDRRMARTLTAPIGVISNTPIFDEARLRDGLRQLAEAIAALHEAGLVHRDVKPSNIRVTLEGRVVLLDFGLVARTEESSWTEEAAGTPDYMAPEQVSSTKVGPEADWYAVGAILFEALTGSTPFAGSALEVMMRKQREQPPAPRDLNDEIPMDLDALCSALIRVLPSERPKDQEILRALGGARSSMSPKTHGPPTQSTRPAPFIGREVETEALFSAFRASRTEPVTVLIEGESGVGKTALVRQFLHRLSLYVSDVVVLAGRCYERESIPYKAFDGVVDALARLLSHLPKEDAGVITPTKPGPLVKVFPALRRVGAVAERVRGPQPLLPPLDLRARAFAALRDLFTRLCDRRPLVVNIDDAQWADPDSLALLAELMRPPDAPRMLLVMTARAEHAQNAEAHGPTLASTMQGAVRRIELGPLPPDEANALALELLDRAGFTDPQLAVWSARQAAGHPLFIDMMIRQADQGRHHANENLRLEDALGAIIGQLEDTPRAILDTVSIAASPMAQEAVARATGVGGDAFRKAVSLLRVSHMVQTRGARDSDRIEPYHDRVRTAVLAHLDPTRSAAVHRRIALTLEGNQTVDPESLVAHWCGAGDLERAANFAMLAGDRASEALAFDRAASFYELALESTDTRDSDGRALLVKLGEARANAGRGETAAEAFQKAADAAPALEALHLRRRAAEELLMAGDFDRGTAALHQVLAAVGMRAPRSPLATLFWLFVYGIWQTVIGLRFKERRSEEISPLARARVDALFAATRGFALVDPLLSRCMSRRHLITALRTGDTTQVMRAATFEVSSVPIAGGPISKRERRLVAIAQRLPEMDATGVAKGFFRSTLGVSLYLRDDWIGALENLDGAYSNSEGRGTGRQANAQLFAAWTLMFMGEYKELARRHATLLADANARGDLYTSVLLRDGYMAVMWLAADEPEMARRHIQEAIARWSRSRFLLQHWHAMLGETDIELYLGNGEAAYERCARDLPAVEKSLLLKCEQVRIWTMFMRGRCAVASANAAPEQRKQRLLEARSMIRQLEREFPACSALFAALVSAAASNVEGDRPRAIAALQDAIHRAEAAHMSMHAAAARSGLGLLLGSDEGAALVRQAEDAMKAQDVKVPSRLAAIWLPGRWGVV
jgi:serine/threonine protein kinase/tetratricopeptide (TPR) repeat protein